MELTENGGFEASEAGSTSPVNWSLATADGGAVIQVISAADQPANVRSGDRALEVAITTLGADPWSIEVTYDGLSNAGIPVNGGSIYSYSVWVKGPAGALANFTVGTPAPGYAERARSNRTLSGDWEEVTLEVVTDSADTLLRLPIHLSIAGNEGKTIYLDDMSFMAQESVTYEYSPVTVESLYSLSPDMPIGVAVPAGNSQISPLTNMPRQTVVKQHFSQLTAENIMKPSYLQPSQGEFFWDEADALIDFAEDNGLTVHGHTLLWHTQIPSWMQNFSGTTKEEWLDMMRAHITAVAGRYADRPSVVSWDVVNEAFEDAGGRYRGSESGTGSSVWYQNIGSEFIEEAFKAAHAAAPNADLYYNDFSTEWNRPKLDAVIAMVEDFLDRDIPIDGIGFQMHVWSNANVPTIRQHLRDAAALGVKVKITELDVRFNHVNPPLSANAYTPALAEQHKNLIKGIVEAYLEEVPPAQRGGITVWGIADADSWIVPLYGRPDWSLFFFNDMSPKPALQGFADALMAE